MSKDAHHVMVCGPSGGGKTTYVKEMHARHDGPSIFLSPKIGDEYPGDIQDAREIVRSSGGGQVIIDEAQNAPTFQGEDGPARRMLHEDREDGVKCVIVTQNPQDLRTQEWNYGPLQQCQYFVWVGEARTWHRGFREWLNVDPDDLPEEQHLYVVFKPTDPPEAVVRGETDPSFH